MSKPLTVSDAARRLGGLSRARVIQLDAELQPRRGDLGVRLYDPTRVDAFAAERRTRQEARSRR
jgi:hypothetical protein